jgi:predicted RNA methylase
MLKHAQDKYNFYETPHHHSTKIFDDCIMFNKSPLKVIDICCGLGSLVRPFYEAGHDITLVEINKDFIPILKQDFPRAKILEIDFLTSSLNEEYDVYLCNPPFNSSNEKHVYTSFFCKILKMMTDDSVLYFICPKMFYKNQDKIKIEWTPSDNFILRDYIKEHHVMPSSFYFKDYGLIELDSNGFRFNKTMIKRMIQNKIISHDFIDSDDNMIIPYFEFRYIGNIFDFKTTNCKCGIFKVNK